MPRTPPKAIQDELFMLNNQLWDELIRVFRDIDYWQLEPEPNRRRAYLDDYEIDEDGKLKIKVLYVATHTAFDGSLDGLANGEDPSRARVLARRIRELKKLLNQEEATGGR